MGRQIEVETEICIGIPNYPITKPVSYCGVSRNGDYFSENWQQFLCFSVTFSSFNLTHRINKRNWTEEQQRNHDLIKSLHDSGLGYRKIADYLNAHGIKTVRGNTWKNTQVFSVLKRYQQKLDREEVRELLKLGLSQKAVAKEMGISTASVARLK